MTKIEAAAAHVERAERKKDAAFHEASLAREASRRAMLELRAVIAAERARRVA